MTPPIVDASAMATVGNLPLRDLFLALPGLPITSAGGIDFEAADPQILLRIAVIAETAMQMAHRGLAAVGLLFFHAGPLIDAGDISGEAVAAIGWLMADLGELLVFVQELATACRAHTVDYNP